MTYYLDPEVKKIKSPIILCVDGKETAYANGQALSKCSFEKRFAIRSVTARDNQVVIVLEDGIECPNPGGVDHADFGIAD